MRTRLRPKYSDAELAEIYSRPHDIDPTWLDHKLRIDESIAMFGRHDEGIYSVADLSCGSAFLVEAAPTKVWHLGDYAPGYQYTGPIEKTIHEIPHVDAFCLYETLEHLDDPDEVLALIRGKSHRLFLSTPLTYGIDDNPEHYWSWDSHSLSYMLKAAGWEPKDYFLTRPSIGYYFQIWYAE